MKKKKARKLTHPFPLRTILEKQGISQRQLARATGITEQRITDLVHGRRDPLWSTVLRICTSAGVDMGDLKPSAAPAAKRERKSKRAAPITPEESTNGADQT